MPLCQFPKLTFVSFIARHSEREGERAREIRQQIVVVVSAAAGTAKKGSAGVQAVRRWQVAVVACIRASSRQAAN